MKKLLFILIALAIATPAMALQIIATDEGGGIVRIDYVMTSGEKRARGIAIDVNVASPVTIDSFVVASFKTGVSTNADRKFGIYPSKIAINGTTGTVTSYGDPESPLATLPTDTKPGLGTQGVTLEFGSLYSPTTTDTNAPLPNTGGTIMLCKLQLAAHGATSTLFHMALNNSRGGIVTEDANAAVSPVLTDDTVDFTTPPPAPTNVAATDYQYSDKVQVTWDASLGATSYDVYRNTSNSTTGMVSLGNIAASPYPDTSATGDIQYYYAVKAKNAAGDSVNFSNIDGGVRAGSNPGVPTGVGATNLTYCDKIRVTWTAPAKAFRYDVYRATTNNTSSAVLLAAGTDVVGSPFDDLTPNTTSTYYYWVKAKNGFGSSTYSANLTTGGKRLGVPAAPGGVAASDSSFADKVRVTWNANTATSYDVYRSATNGTTGMALMGNVAASPWQYDDTTATAGTLYYYAVRPLNVCGTGNWSAIDGGRRAAQLTTSPTATATDGVYSDKVRVTWTATTGATSYDVYRNASNSTTGAALLGNVAAMTGGVWLYDDTTAVAPTVYWYFIKAKNAVGDSTVFGGGNDGFRYASGIPARPIGVKATQGLFVNKVAVTWTACAGATSYDVYRNTSSGTTGSVLQGNVTDPTVTYNDTSLPATYISYYYFVRAKNGSGTSIYSAATSGYGISSDASCLVAGNTINGLTITTTMVSKWTTLGKPKCWCCDAQKFGNGIYMGTSLNSTDLDDLAAVKVAYNISYNAAGYIPCVDFDLSGTIDLADLAKVKQKYNTTQTATGCK